MSELVTCVITTYKRKEKFLRRALESIVNQTYDNIEILIMDDNENDKFHDIVVSVVNDYDSTNIKHVFNGENMGVQMLRNQAIELSNGKYIGYLDDDDIWYSNKIKEQVSIFQNNPHLGLVYCGYDILEINDNKVSRREIEVPAYEGKKESLIQLLRKNYIASTSLPLINKKVFNKVGKFDESLIASQDYDMWVRIVKEFNIKRVNRPLAIYIKHNGNRISSNPKRKAKAEIMFLDKHYSLLAKDYTALSNKLMMVGLYLLKSSREKEARNYFIRSIKFNPKNIRLYKYLIETFMRS